MVKERKREHSYTIQVKENKLQEAHVIQLKRCREEEPRGKPVPLFYFQGGFADMETEQDEGEVERIVRHRIGKDGEFEFLTKWVGLDASENTWEPVRHFFAKYCANWVKYVKDHNLQIDVVKFLSHEPGFH